MVIPDGCLGSLARRKEAVELARAAGQHSPSLTLLPALTSLQVYCTSKFLEGLVSRFDVPSLEKMNIKFPQDKSGTPRY
jgi:hypothetical protein